MIRDYLHCTVYTVNDVKNNLEKRQNSGHLVVFLFLFLIETFESLEVCIVPLEMRL